MKCSIRILLVLATGTKLDYEGTEEPDVIEPAEHETDRWQEKGKREAEPRSETGQLPRPCRGFWPKKASLLLHCDHTSRVSEPEPSFLSGPANTSASKELQYT